MTRLRETERIVDEIMNDMTLREKAMLASLKESELLHFHDLFDAWVGNHPDLDDEIGREILHRIWEVLQDSHRIRRVK